MRDAPAILVSAGEPSGDAHGGPLVAALRRRLPGVPVEAVGGPCIEAAGARVRWRLERLSALGFLEVLGQVPLHYRLLRTLERESRAGRFRLAVLIDYPGFHLRLGRRLRRAGVPVLYYVAPQLWAWRPGRLTALRAAADRLAVILPFEVEWFGARGVPCRFVGHPLLDGQMPSGQEARRALGLPEGVPVLGIFPGSRPREIQRHWPLFRTVACRMLEEGRAGVGLVAAVPGGAYPEPGPLRVLGGDPRAILAASSAALVKSGTATLEAALAGTPMVVAYETSRMTYEIARRLMTVRHIALANLVAEEAVVPEFWHPPLAAEPLAAALRDVLRPESDLARRQRTAFRAIRERLGPPGAAERVADMALELLAA